MPRPVTLFTGQWADLPLAELAPLASDMGYDGLELACWGDHFDVDRGDRAAGLRRPSAARCWSTTACSATRSRPISSARPCATGSTSATRRSCPPHVWGDGDPEGVRQRAAHEVGRAAEAARAFGVDVVNGFTGSSIWHSIYAFPPTSQAYWDAGFRDFAKRWTPILDAFDEARRELRARGAPDRDRVRHRLVRARARGGRRPPAVRLQLRPVPPRLPGRRLRRSSSARFGDRIFHVHMKDVWWGHGDGSVGVFGGHTSFGDARRYWDFRSLGRGDINFEDIIVALNDVGYGGPLTVEWEDSRMDRVHGATESAAFVKRARLRAVERRVRRRLRPGRAVTRPLRYGMVGGGRNAFIGAVHRAALRSRSAGCPGRRGALVGSDAGARVGARSRPRLRAGVRLVAGDARARARTPGG